MMCGWESALRVVDQVGLAQETGVFWPPCCRLGSQELARSFYVPLFQWPLGKCTHEGKLCRSLTDPLRIDYMRDPGWGTKYIVIQPYPRREDC